MLHSPGQRGGSLALGLGLYLALGASSLGHGAAGPTPIPWGLRVPLDDAGFDMELDRVRHRLYVSVPDRNEITVISTDHWNVVDHVVVGTRPHGIDISLDGELLFVALNQASSVVYLDLETFGFTQVVIGAELGSAATYDVVEAKPDRIFASADPGSSGFAYITMIKRDEGNAATRVAGETIIRARPVFAAGPERKFLYIGEGFSPESLYQLDLSTDLAPIALEDQHGSVSGTDHLEVSPDGERIYLGSGQVLRTADFIQIGLTGPGVPRLNENGTRAYVASAPGSIDVYETETFLSVDTFDLPCSLTEIRDFELLPNESGFVVLGDSEVCVVPGGAFFIADAR